MPLYLPPRPLGYTPPTGGAYQNPMNVISSGVSAQTSGVFTASPLDVGPVARSYNGIGVGVGTAQAGGTSTCTLAIYGDDGSGGYPNMVGGPVVSGTVVLTATGNAIASIAWNPAPGRYWLAFLWYASAAPTTAPSLNAINASTLLWVNAGGTIGANSRALTASGLTAMPTTRITLTAVTASTAPVVAVRTA